MAESREHPKDTRNERSGGKACRSLSLPSEGGLLSLALSKVGGSSMHLSIH